MNDKNEGRKYMLKNLLCHVVFEAAKVVFPLSIKDCLSRI
jgi:hypothetical protein